MTWLTENIKEAKQLIKEQIGYILEETKESILESCCNTLDNDGGIQVEEFEEDLLDEILNDVFDGFILFSRRKV